MNLHAIRAIYLFELARTWRTLLQSIVSPVLSTSLYFVVFGSAIGSHMVQIDGVSYGAFIVPGDGDMDFDPVFRVLADAGYQGWLLVEAEQDPAKADPLEYAIKGRSYIRAHTGL